MSQPTPPPDRPGRSFFAIVIVVALLGGIAMSFIVQPPRQATQINFSTFTELLADDKVESVVVNTQTQTVTGVYTRGKGDKKQQVPFQTAYPADFSKTMTDVLLGNEVDYTINNSKPGGSSMLLLLGIAALAVVGFLFFRSRSQQGKSGNGAPGRMVEAGEVTVNFNDVAGCDEVVAELQEIKEFLSDPERFRKLGASIPKGVLLFGPPGTGKTLLARAVAGEAEVPFFSISGSDFVEMYVGVGASRVRKLFEQAKAQAPCVIFIDEIDAVGRRRSGNAQGGQEERENTLNQLLVEIDGFAPNDNVIVIAASNRADILDPALTRPGRFDRQVTVDVPDRAGRAAILAVHGRGKPLAEGVSLDGIAAQTAGFSGADLANLLNEAALLAARGGRDCIGKEDLEEATMRVVAGPQKTRMMSDKEKVVTAAHEMGHAIVANRLPDAEPVHKVTIVGRGRALGLTVMLQDEDKLLRTRSELKAQIAVALGGRVAEELMFGEITTGAANDLERVNQVAQTMVLRLGMSDEFALRSYLMDDRVMVHSDELGDRLDAEVDAIVNEAKAVARDILTRDMALLQRLTRVLVELETIDREQFEQLMESDDRLLVEGEAQSAQVVHIGANESPAPAPDDAAPDDNAPHDIGHAA